MKLTIGMAHHSDFDGAYFTIQDIRKELLFNGRGDLLQNIEFMHCTRCSVNSPPVTKQFTVYKQECSNVKTICNSCAVIN